MSKSLSRQDFLKTSFLGIAGLYLSKINAQQLHSLSNEKLALENSEFYPDFQFGSFNYGYAGATPLILSEAQEKTRKLLQHFPYSILEKIKSEIRENNRKLLAEWLKVEVENLSFQTNTTYALNQVIFGLDLPKKSKIALCEYDYPFVLNAWKQKAKREDLSLFYVTISPNDSDEVIVEKYKNTVEKQKLSILHLTHVWNWNGRVLPILDIIEIAKKNGVKVIIDGAHAIGLLDVTPLIQLTDIYIGTFHKWLNSGISLSFLHLKKDIIPSIFPLESAYPSQEKDIRKFETSGVRDLTVENTFPLALELHHNFGNAEKLKRLQYLRELILRGLEKSTNWRTHNIGNYNGMIFLQHKVLDGKTIATKLQNEHGISVGLVHVGELNGIRVSPHFTCEVKDVSRLINLLLTI